MATPSCGEGTSTTHGLCLELTLKPPHEHSNPQENKCMCSSPSNNPLVPSQRYTSKNMVLLKTAMKKSMLNMWRKMAEFAEKSLNIKPMPRTLLRRRRKAFQIRPSGLSTMSDAQEYYMWLRLWSIINCFLLVFLVLD